jgi:transposase
VKGQNSPALNWSQRKLEKQLARLEERLAEYMAALEQADRQDGAAEPELDAAQLREKIAQIQASQQGQQAKLQTLARTGETQLSATDPDSRGMKGRQGHVVGYNVQGVADGKHHLLVVTEVVNSAADQAQLQPMVQAIQAEAPVLPKALAADGGYYAAEGIKYCEDQGVAAHLAAVKNSPSERAGLFGKGDFRYQPETDTYRCPAGQELPKHGAGMDNGRRLGHYYNRQACVACPLKARCTKTDYRTVSRWEHEDVLERMQARVAADPEPLGRRKTIIEHCWGTLKWLLPGGFLLKGLEKVKAEVSLAHWAYNYKRALKVVGLPGLMAALQPIRQGAAS